MAKYTEEQIQEIERELDKQIDNENEVLKEIEQQAESITKKLTMRNHVRDSFMGNEFYFSLGEDAKTKELVLTRTDPVVFAIAGPKYRPAIFRAQRDENFSMFENVYVLVKAALCSKAGIINVEEIEE